MWTPSPPASDGRWGARVRHQARRNRAMNAKTGQRHAGPCVDPSILIVGTFFAGEWRRAQPRCTPQRCPAERRRRVNHASSASIVPITVTPSRRPVARGPRSTRPPGRTPVEVPSESRHPPQRLDPDCGTCSTGPHGPHIDHASFARKHDHSEGRIHARQHAGADPANRLRRDKRG